MIIWWYVRQWLKIELDKQTWLWRLYKKDRKEIPILSNEYRIATLNSINFMRWELKDILNNFIDRNKYKQEFWEEIQKALKTLQKLWENI